MNETGTGLLHAPGAAAPVLLVGCSRSGTSVMVRLLEGLGVAMGVAQSGNRESLVFQEANRALLDLLGCSWRCVEHLPTVEQLSGQYDYLMRAATKRLEGGGLAEHLGPEAERLLRQPGLLWGWKDPRTSLLLPVWKRVFPQAKIIHMLRDGREVAQSLKQREDARHKGAGYQTPEQGRARFLADIDVWRDYVRRIGQALPLFGRSLTICYEDLLARPQQVLVRAADFLGVAVPANLDELAGIVSGYTPGARLASLPYAPGALVDAEVEATLAQWRGAEQLP